MGIRRSGQLRPYMEADCPADSCRSQQPGADAAGRLCSPLERHPTHGVRYIACSLLENLAFQVSQVSTAWWLSAIQRPARRQFRNSPTIRH
jgi:hypothetical protein